VTRKDCKAFVATTTTTQQGKGGAGAKAEARRRQAAGEVTVGELVQGVIRKVTSLVLKDKKADILRVGLAGVGTGIKGGLQEAGEGVDTALTRLVMSSAKPKEAIQKRALCATSEELKACFGLNAGVVVTVRAAGLVQPCSVLAKIMLVQAAEAGTNKSGKVVSKTCIKDRTTSPEWKEEYTMKPLASFDDKVKVVLTNQRVFQADRHLGWMQVTIRELIDSAMAQHQNAAAAAGPEATLPAFSPAAILGKTFTVEKPLIPKEEQDKGHVGGHVVLTLTVISPA